MFIRWWRLQGILTCQLILTVLLVRRVLHHETKNIVYLNHLEKSKLLKVMKRNQHLIYENHKAILLKILLDTYNYWIETSAFLCFSFILFVETMLLSKSLISRNFLKPNRFWLPKEEKISTTSEGNGRKNAQHYKTIISTIYMKPDLL